MTMHMTSSISLLREALQKSLEPTTSSTPTKNKKHVTYCGYCYYAKRSWQIRFKPYGVSFSVGVLGGNLAVPTAQKPSQWLGRLMMQSSSAEGAGDPADPPAHIVMMVLKRAELCNIFQLARNQVENGRKHFQKLVVKLRDEREVDLAPILGEIMGQKRLHKYRTLNMLEFAIAYTKSAKMPGLEHPDWKLQLAGQAMEDNKFDSADAVKAFVNSCLDASITGEETSYEADTPEHQQVAGAATGESSGETPRSSLETPPPPSRPETMQTMPLRVRFQEDQLQTIAKTPPVRLKKRAATNVDMLTKDDGERKSLDEKVEAAQARDTREDESASMDWETTSAAKEIGESESPNEKVEAATSLDTRAYAPESTESDATLEPGEIKSPAKQVETAPTRDIREDSSKSTEDETASAAKEVGETKTRGEKVETAQARDTGEYSSKSTEDDTAIAAKEIGETKTPDKKVETAPARDTREDSSESLEGDTASAGNEVGEIKSPDEKVETVPARDTREDPLESTKDETASAAKEVGESESLNKKVEAEKSLDTRGNHTPESTEYDTTSPTRELWRDQES